MTLHLGRKLEPTVPAILDKQPTVALYIEALEHQVPSIYQEHLEPLLQAYLHPQNVQFVY